MIFSKFLEKLHPLRGGSLPPSWWSLSSAALSPSLLKSPPLVLDSLASDARSLELPPDLLGRRGRQVSSSFLVHGSVAIGAGRLHPRSKKTRKPGRATAWWWCWRRLGRAAAQAGLDGHLGEQLHGDDVEEERAFYIHKRERKKEIRHWTTEIYNCAMG